jgi:hypothetical protein
MNYQVFEKISRKRKYVDPQKNPSAYKPLSWGQMKLMVYHLRFLTMAREDFPDTKQVVYAGAAPGSSFVLLSKLFPELTFYLFDPAEFDNLLCGIRNVVIENRIFGESDMKKDSLFMCDIRRSDDEKSIEKDMDEQKRWVTKGSPVRSSLKFRLPFSEGKTKYFDGRLVLQAFAPVSSTELRLEFDGIPDDREYDHTEVEEKMAFHNLVNRTTPVSTELFWIDLRKVFRGALDFVSFDAAQMADAAARFVHFKKRKVCETEVRKMVLLMLNGQTFENLKLK